MREGLVPAERLPAQVLLDELGEERGVGGMVLARLVPPVTADLPRVARVAGVRELLGLADLLQARLRPHGLPGRPAARRRTRRRRAFPRPDGSGADGEDVGPRVVQVGQAAEDLLEGLAVLGPGCAAVVAGVGRRGDDEPGAALQPSGPGHRRRGRRAHRGDVVGHHDLDGIVRGGPHGHRLEPAVGIAGADPGAEEGAARIGCGDRPTDGRQGTKHQDARDRHDGGGPAERRDGSSHMHPPKSPAPGDPLPAPSRPLEGGIQARARAAPRAPSAPATGRSTRRTVRPWSSRRPVLSDRRLSRVGFEHRTHGLGRVVQS